LSFLATFFPGLSTGCNVFDKYFLNQSAQKMVC
jgi:hypothetical protein